MKGSDYMLGIRKTRVLATALSTNMYNKLVYITGEKKISISEMVIMSIAMQLTNPDVKVEKTERTPEHKKIITVRVSEGLSSMVEKAAKELGCSKSRYIVDALDNGLNYANKGAV